MGNRKRIPPKTLWYIQRLAKVMESEGLDSVQIGLSKGEMLVGHASLQDRDGNWSYFWCDDGDWYDYEVVG